MTNILILAVNYLHAAFYNITCSSSAGVAHEFGGHGSFDIRSLIAQQIEHPDAHVLTFFLLLIVLGTWYFVIQPWFSKYKRSCNQRLANDIAKTIGMEGDYPDLNALVRQKVKRIPLYNDIKLLQTHVIGVTKIAYYIAGKMGLTSKLKHELAAAAFIHDDGKAICKESVEALNSGRLGECSPEKEELIKLYKEKHTQYSVEIIERDKISERIRLIVEYHHASDDERVANYQDLAHRLMVMYPHDEKMRKELLLETLILNGADIYEAIQKQHPHQRGEAVPTRDKIISELRRSWKGSKINYPAIKSILGADTNLILDKLLKYFSRTDKILMNLYKKVEYDDLLRSFNNKKVVFVIWPGAKKQADFCGNLRQLVEHLIETCNSKLAYYGLPKIDEKIKHANPLEVFKIFYDIVGDYMLKYIGVCNVLRYRGLMKPKPNVRIISKFIKAGFVPAVIDLEFGNSLESYLKRRSWLGLKRGWQKGKDYDINFGEQPGNPKRFTIYKPNGSVSEQSSTSLACKRFKHGLPEGIKDYMNHLAKHYQLVHIYCNDEMFLEDPLFKYTMSILPDAQGHHFVLPQKHGAAHSKDHSKNGHTSSKVREYLEKIHSSRLHVHNEDIRYLLFRLGRLGHVFHKFPILEHMILYIVAMTIARLFLIFNPHLFESLEHLFGPELFVIFACGIFFLYFFTVASKKLIIDKLFLMSIRQKRIGYLAKRYIERWQEGPEFTVEALSCTNAQCCLALLKDPKRAIDILNRIDIKLLEKKSENNYEITRLLTEIHLIHGECCAKLNQLKKSEAEFLLALDLIKGKCSGWNKDKNLSAFRYRAAVGLGHLSNTRGQHVQAVSQYNDALEALNRGGLEFDKRTVAVTLSQLVRFYLKIGYWTKAYEYSLKALNEVRAIGNGDIAARILKYIGVIFWYRDNFERAEEYILQSLKKRTTPKSIALTYRTLGIMYFNFHRFEQAYKAIRTSYLKWNDITSDNPDDIEARIGKSEALHYWGVLCWLKAKYGYLNDRSVESYNDEAIGHLSDAIYKLNKLYRQRDTSALILYINIIQHLSNSYFRRAVVYNDMGRKKEADRDFRKSFNLAEELQDKSIGDFHMKAKILNRLSGIEAARQLLSDSKNQNNSIIEKYAEVLHIRQPGYDDVGRCKTLLNKARFLQGLREFKLAEALFGEALGIASSMGSDREAFKILVDFLANKYQWWVNSVQDRPNSKQRASFVDQLLHDEIVTKTVNRLTEINECYQKTSHRAGFANGSKAEKVSIPKWAVQRLRLHTAWKEDFKDDNLFIAAQRIIESLAHWPNRLQEDPRFAQCCLNYFEVELNYVNMSKLEDLFGDDAKNLCYKVPHFNLYPQMLHITPMVSGM